MKSAVLQTLLDQGQVWAGELSAKTRGRSTGHAQLDSLLAGGGWPYHGLIEIQTQGDGMGELQLLLPSLAQAEHRLWIWLDPPMQPCAQALQQAGLDLSRCLILRTQNQGDALWALERCLQSGCVDSALSWLRQAPALKALRRLQMAAERGRSLAHLMHDGSWSLDAGTHVRIALWPAASQPGQIEVQVQRQRGGPQRQPIALPLLAAQACQPTRPKPAQFKPVHLDPKPHIVSQPSLQLSL